MTSKQKLLTIPALVLAALASGCGQQAAAPVNTSPVTNDPQAVKASAESQKQFIQNNPGLPPAEREAMLKHLQSPTGPTTH